MLSLIIHGLSTALTLTIIFQFYACIDPYFNLHTTFTTLHSLLLASESSFTDYQQGLIATQSEENQTVSSGYRFVTRFILPHCHTATLPHYHTTTLPHYHTTTLPHYHTTTLPHYHTTTLPNYHTTTLLLPHYHTTTLPHYHTTTRPHYHTTTPPHYNPNPNSKPYISQKLKDEFTKLTADIQRSVEVTNRDRFTQKLTIFRLNVRQFLAL
jgi:hypothetical protein